MNSHKIYYLLCILLVIMSSVMFYKGYHGLAYLQVAISLLVTLNHLDKALKHLNLIIEISESQDKMIDEFQEENLRLRKQWRLRNES